MVPFPSKCHSAKHLESWPLWVRKTEQPEIQIQLQLVTSRCVYVCTKNDAAVEHLQ